jgi:hypothetical protein
MRTIDFFAQLKAFVQHVAGTAITVASNGTGFDKTGYEGGLVVAQVGSTTGTPTSFTVTFKLQHSKDNSVWADALDANNAAISGVLTAVGALKLRIDGVYLYKYLRVVATPVFVGGTSPTAVISSELLLGDTSFQPVA